MSMAEGYLAKGESLGLYEIHGPYVRLGKFNHPMASYLWDRMMQGDEGNEYVSTPAEIGDWIIRYGKRTLEGDNDGFVNFTRHDGIEEAKEYVNLWRNDHPDYEEEESAGYGVACCDLCGRDDAHSHTLDEYGLAGPEDASYGEDN